MGKTESPKPDLGELPPDYVDDNALITAEQAPPAAHASCTSLMTWLYRYVVPNRWPKS